MAPPPSGHDRRTADDDWVTPSFLDFGVGGYARPSISVKWRSTGLLVIRREWDTRSERPESHFTRPPVAAWLRFWEDLDAVGIARWAASYCTPHIKDGTGWRANLVAPNLRVTSRGSNRYPAAVALAGEPSALDTGSEDRGPVWTGFCEAVERLSGQEFR